MTRGEAMKKARRRAGLTLRQLEERSGVRAGTRACARIGPIRRE